MKNLLENNKKELMKLSKENELKEKNLKNRELNLLEKEKEFNNQITFLEDKENLIEIENQQIQKNNERFKKIEEENKNLLKKIKLEEEIKKLKEKRNIKIYKKPILIGLNNIGATCFMNSTLQLFESTRSLTDYFLNEENKEKILNNFIAIKNKKELQLSPVYLELVKELWNANGPKSFSPNNFMKTVEKMNPLFKQGQPGNSKDFIIFILEQIHKELKQPNKNYIENKNQILNQYDKNNAFQFFFNDFQKIYQLYQIFSLDLMKQQMNVLIVKINIIYKV